MNSYGRVISGGAQMRKGLTGNINDKVEGHNSDLKRKEVIATAVNNAYKVNTVSSQHTNDVKNFGKFKKPSVPSKV
jgi:hypothetical protein